MLYPVYWNNQTVKYNIIKTNMPGTFYEGVVKYTLYMCGQDPDDIS